MIQNLPVYISLIFILTTIAAIIFFYFASGNSKIALTVISAWTIVQGVISLTGFYTVTNFFPPRFTLLIMPPLALVVILFHTQSGKRFIDGFDLKILTYLNTVRVPVEIVLYFLFVQKQIPELMTFEGRNFDILAGLTAPLVAYFGFTKKILSRKIILVWNIVCLCLLINIVVNAFLAAPFPTQQFAFDQPNVAILYFPFVWLPCCVVPLVLFSHLVSIRKLIMNQQF